MGPRLLASGLALLLASQSMLFTVASVHAQSGAAATGTEEQAREAFQRGRVHYDNGEFAQAAIAFGEAYKLSGRDVLLYNLYLAHRDANQMDQAAEALRSYLAKVEVIENRPQLEARLKALDEGIAQRNAAEADKQQQTPTEDGEPESSAGDQAAAPRNERWWIVPVAVMAGGAVMTLGSVATGLAASSKHKTLEDKCVDGACPANLKSTATQGRVLSFTTDVLLFGGLGVLGTGAVLFLLRRPGSADPAPDSATARLRPDVGCSAQGCEGSLTLTF